MDTVKSQRRWLAWIVLMLLALLVAGIGGYAWFVESKLGTTSDGTRISLVAPGSGAVVRAHGQLPIELAPDLAAAGLKTEHQGMGSEVEQTFILRREKHILRIRLTAGKQPVATGRLGYVLSDAGGIVIGQGTLLAEVRLAADAEEVVQIVDPNLPSAARVEIRNLP